MTILTRYLTREFLKLFGVFVCVFVSIFLIIDFIGKVDNFIESKAPLGSMVGYFLYKLPFIVVQMVPVATLLSVIVMLSVMVKHNEITALKASGVSIGAVSAPIVYVALALTLGVFLVSEAIVPYTSSRSNGLWDLYVMKRGQTRQVGRTHIWHKGTDSIYWISMFDPESRVLKDCSFYFFDKGFRVTKRIDARLVRWTGTEWRMGDGVVLEAADDGGYGLCRVTGLVVPISEKPVDFEQSVRKPEEMSYWQLKRYAEKIRDEGYDPTSYLVDMHVKTAFPFIIVVMALMGVPVVMGLKRGGTPLAVCVGIGTCFLYLLVLGVSRSLGLSGTLPPLFSAWLANGVFFFVALYLLLRLET